MVDVDIKGRVVSRSATREYDFLVDTGATWVGLPQEDIEALDLDPSMFAPSGKLASTAGLSAVKSTRPACISTIATSTWTYYR